MLGNRSQFQIFPFELLIDWWLFVAGYWLLIIGCWLFVCCCLLVVGCWLLIVGYWLLVVGCWLLGVSYWLLVVCYSLFAVWQRYGIPGSLQGIHRRSMEFKEALLEKSCPNSGRIKWWTEAERICQNRPSPVANAIQWQEKVAKGHPKRTKRIPNWRQKRANISHNYGRGQT